MKSAYQQYKASEIGWLGDIPSHWQKNKFKYLLREKTKTQNIDLPCGSISFGKVVYKDSEKLTEETKLAYQEVLSSEFLINPLNLNYDLKSLRTALSEIDVIVSSGYMVLQSEGVVDKNYLKWLLFVFDIRHMKTLGAGIRQTITFKDIGNCTTFLPPENEQIFIGEFLDRETARIDNLIAEKQNFIKLLKEKRQALISHVVTKGLDPNVKMKDSGIEWIGEVPEHWAITSLKHFCSLIKDGTHNPPQRVDYGIPLLSVRNIIDGEYVFRDDDSFISEESFKELNKYFQVKKGDVLLAIVGGTIGKTAIVKTMEHHHIQRSLALFRVKESKLTPEFLHYFMQSNYFYELLWSNVGFSAQPGIYLGSLANFDIVAPSLIEQYELVRFLNEKSQKLSSIIKETENSIELLKEHRTALISAAVTGKIDVRHNNRCPPNRSC